MKRKLFIGLFVFIVVFIAGGLYLILAIDNATRKLHNLVTIHQVEIIREHLLLRIKRVQFDLNLKDTRFARDIDTIVSDVNVMDKSAKACFGCHHSPEVNYRLLEMDRMIDGYKDAVIKVFSMRAAKEHTGIEESAAFEQGEAMISLVNGMIATTAGNLERKTHETLDGINRAKYIIFGFIAIGSFLVVSIAFYLVKEFFGQIGALLKATGEFKKGATNYDFSGLRDEFRDVGDSLNEMAKSLDEYWTKIRDSELRYRTLFESAASSIFILDLEARGKIVDANPTAEIMSGYNKEELLNMHITDLDTDDSASKAPERISRIMKGEKVFFEVEHRRKDGSVYPLEANVSLLEIRGHKYAIAIDRDITDRKEAQEKLIRAEQMKLCGEMATGLAHEIKNPLAGIKASIEVLSEELDLQENDRFVMRSIVGEIDRIESLLNELLNFARPVKPQFIDVDLNEIVESVFAVAAHGKKRPDNLKIDMVFDLQEGLPPIMADPMHIKQALLNIYVNALESMPEGGVFSVTSWFDSSNNKVNLRLSDTGTGIPDVLRDKIFKPFCTTKSKGTGIGLAITKQIIENHGGVINLSDNTDKGTAFTLSFPAVTSYGEKA